MAMKMLACKGKKIKQLTHEQEMRNRTQSPGPRQTDPAVVCLRYTFHIHLRMRESVCSQSIDRELRLLFDRKCDERSAISDMPCQLQSDPLIRCTVDNGGSSCSHLPAAASAERRENSTRWSVMRATSWSLVSSVVYVPRYDPLGSVLGEWEDLQLAEHRGYAEVLPHGRPAVVGLAISRLLRSSSEPQL